MEVLRIQLFEVLPISAPLMPVSDFQAKDVCSNLSEKQ